MTLVLQLTLIHLVFSAILTLAALYLQFFTYPKLSSAEKGSFVDFHNRSSKAIFIFFIVFMFLEVFSLYLITQIDKDISYYDWLPLAIFIVALWMITFFFMLKIDEKLNSGKHEKIIKELSNWNWMRIFLWFSKTILLAAELVKSNLK